MKSGQILILVLLVVVVALAVGLSVASRNITNLRTSTQTEQSQRAFSAAEGGVEDILSRLGQVGTDIAAGSGANSGCAITGNNASCPVNVGNLSEGGITANVNVKASNIYEFTLEPSQVGQVNLMNADGTFYNGDVKIEWINIKDGDAAAVEDVSPKASIEVAIVCEPNATSSCGNFSFPGNSYIKASSGYSQNRAAFQAESMPTNQTGFVNCDASVDFRCKNPGSISLNSADKSRIIRIKPFWKKATIRVTGGNGFPVQTYEVESVASTEIGVTRRVKVTRTAVEQLPAAFDYVLFSEGNIVK